MHPAVDPSSGACCCSETDVAITHVDFLSTWQVARANVLARSTHQRRFACDAAGYHFIRTLPLSSNFLNVEVKTDGVVVTL